MDGYIQIEINGENVGLKYNMYAMENLFTTTKESKLVNTGNYAATVNLVWAGYVGNCFAKQIEPELLFEEISEWVEIQYLDDIKRDILNKIGESLTNSQAFKKLTGNGQLIQQAEAEGAKKKKQIGSTSMKSHLAKSA